MITIENNILRNTAKQEYQNIDLFTLIAESLFGEKAQGRLALVNTEVGAAVTFGELAKTVNAVATNLQRYGFKQRNVLSIYCHNTWEYAAMMLAVLKLKGVVAPINDQLVKGEIDQAFQIVKPNYVFVNSLGLPLIQQLQATSHPEIRHIISLHPHSGCIAWSELVDQWRDAVPSSKSTTKLPDTLLDPSSDTALIMFSSGTTGFPKAVELTHKTLVYSLLNKKIVFKLIRSSPAYVSDRAVLYQPLSHIYGIELMSVSLLRNAVMYLMPSFHLDAYLDIICKHKIPKMSLVPPLAVMLVKHPRIKEFDLSHITQVFCGAAPLSRKIQEELIRLLPLVRSVNQAFGMTETAGAFTIGDSLEPQSVGLLLPGMELKVVDMETKTALPSGQTGEICCRGPFVMKGYLDNQQATSETIDEDGWLHTGDLGYCNDKGYLFLVGRLKELIKYSAYQVSPSEIENVLLHHENVTDAGVVGLPDETRGELPMAWVVLKPGAKTTEKDIMDYVAERVAPFKKLRGGVRFVSSIPKSRSGKILRKVMRSTLEKEASKL